MITKFIDANDIRWSMERELYASAAPSIGIVYILSHAKSNETRVHFFRWFSVGNCKWAAVRSVASSIFRSDWTHTKPSAVHFQGFKLICLFCPWITLTRGILFRFFTVFHTWTLLFSLFFAILSCDVVNIH